MTGHHGWIPPDERTADQQRNAESIVAMMPQFNIVGGFATPERSALWKAFGKIGVDPIPYIWQTTGSCVGAGGGNMLMTLSAVEIATGEAEEFHLPWWLYTYGESREIAGMRGRGDGSYGAAYAEAIHRKGIFRSDVDSSLPDFRRPSGWLQLPSRVEFEWSDGYAIAASWDRKAREHLVSTVAEIRSTDQAAAALDNGYPLTVASMFGTRGARTRGTPPVNIAEWDTRWAHQMFVDECWRHPTEGLLFRIGNSWGPSAHKSPQSGEPAGGFYVTEKTFGDIIRDRSSEVYAFSGFDGFPARQIDWDVSW